MRTATISTLIAAACLAAACQSDGYETGDGRYSYLRADLVEARTAEAGTITAATTDDGERLTLSTPSPQAGPPRPTPPTAPYSTTAAPTVPPPP